MTSSVPALVTKISPADLDRIISDVPPGPAGVPILKTLNEAGFEAPFMVACRRRPVRGLMHLIPRHYREWLERNQKIAPCCRKPEQHDVSAWYSTRRDYEIGVPSAYIFHCRCGRKHRRFMMGTGKQPFWDAR